MPSTCVFEFDHPDAVYFSGETVNGRLILNTTKDKTVRDVYILFEGIAKVRWQETRTRRVGKRTQYYTERFRGDETYVYTRTTVFPEGELPAGTHIYEFNIPLPPECPTSCSEKYGEVRYEVTLTLDRPYRFDNVFKQPITVIRQLNLNFMPELLIPLKNEDIKYFCCWPCSSGPVMSVLTIPFGGYAPGQAITYTLEITNDSTGYDLEDGVELILKQTYSFTATSPRHKTRHHTNELASARNDLSCLRLSKRVIQGKLIIPPIAPTNKDGIIRVEYEIEMTISTGTCHQDSDISIPIVIGTVPLAQSSTNPDNQWLIQPTAPNTPEYEPNTPDGEKPPSYDHYKPPSFEEATTYGGKFIDNDKDERNRVDDFIPKYPMYTNFAVPSAPPPPGCADSTESTPLIFPQTDNQYAAQVHEPTNRADGTLTPSTGEATTN